MVRHGAVTLVVSCLGLMLFPSSLLAQTVVSENFNDGTFTSGPSSTDLHWYSANGSGGALSTVTDTNLDATGLVFKSVGGSNVALANFSSSLSLSTGSTVTVSLNFLFPTNTAGDGIRVGLFNNNGTATSANGLANSSDDFGLWVNYNLTALTTNGGVINAATETGTNSTIFLGSDRTFSGLANFTPDTNAHSLTLTYTQPTAGTYNLAYNFDGGSTTNLSTTALTGFNPNEIAFFVVGSSDPVEIDNLVVTATPEPSVACLLAPALMMMLLLGYCGRRRDFRPHLS